MKIPEIFNKIVMRTVTLNVLRHFLLDLILKVKEHRSIIAIDGDDK